MNKVGGLTLSDFYKVTVIKTVCYWQEDIQSGIEKKKKLRKTLMYTVK